jgi:transposase
VIHKEISKRVKVCKRTVERVSHYLKHYSTSKRPKTIPRGRPSKITPEMEQVRPFSMIESLTI